MGAESQRSMRGKGEITAMVRMVVYKLGCSGEPPTLESKILRVWWGEEAQ